MTLARRFLIVAVFALLGPPIGAVVIMLHGMAQWVVSGGSALEATDIFGMMLASVVLFFLSLFLAYPMAITPAALTGLVMACLADRIGGVRLWALISTLIGAMSAALLTLSFSVFGPGSEAIFLKAAAGAVAGCLSTLVAWQVVKRRPAA